MKANKTFLIAVSMCLLLVACGKDDKPAPSQVLAKVNDGEITVMQLNTLLRSLGPAAELAKTKQDTLDYLVNQELLEQKAVELKLDRDPEIMQAMEQAKRQILAASALDKLVGKPTPPSDADVTKYYEGNSALFAQRAMYDFTLFNVASKTLPAGVDGQIKQSRSIVDTRQALQVGKLKFEEKSSRMAAEQLPMNLLEQLSKLKVGDILVQPEGGMTVLVQLNKRDAAPLTLLESRERIQAYLLQASQQESSRNKLDELKKKAAISYLKKFVDTPKDEGGAKAADSKSTLSRDDVNSGLEGLK